MKTKKKAEKSKQKSSESEQISPAEALKRMKDFSQRKEKFIAAIKKSKN
jgi:hypothetical protein